MILSFRGIFCFLMGFMKGLLAINPGISYNKTESSLGGKKMKRIFALAALLTILLCGCGDDGPEAVSLGAASFRYAPEDQTFHMMLVLCDQEGREIATPGKMEITIEDDQGNVLYQGKEKIKKEDFQEGRKIQKKKHLAAQIRIPGEKLKLGKSVSGTVKFSIKNGFSYHLKDLSCEANNCLPVEELSFTYEQLPQEIHIKDPFWHSESVYRIDELTWNADPSMGGIVNLAVRGQKLDGEKGTGPDMIRYDVYDAQGEKVQGGELYMGRYEIGDSFTAQLILSNLIPGETYAIQFSANQ